jgi:hypothetical protein
MEKAPKVLKSTHKSVLTPAELNRITPEDLLSLLGEVGFYFASRKTRRNSLTPEDLLVYSQNRREKDKRKPPHSKNEPYLFRKKFGNRTGGLALIRKSCMYL